MSRSFDGVDDSLSFSGSLGNVFTAAAWVVSAGGGTVYHDGLSGSGNHRNELNVTGTTAIGVLSRDTGQSVAASTAGITDSNWHHVAAVFASATDRRAFLDGGNKGTNATSRNPTGQNTIIVGTRTDGNNDFTGNIAHVAVWSAALDDAEIEMLGAQRVSPLLVRPASLALYLPYIGRDSTEIDTIGGRAFTVTGTTASNDEPPILLVPSKRRIFFVSGGVVNTKILEDDLVIPDEVDRTLKLLRQHGDDTVFSDGTVQIARLRRVHEDDIAGSDESLRRLTLRRSTDDGLESADGFVSWRVLHRVLGEDLEVIDGFLKTVLGSGTVYAKILSDTLTMVDDAGNRWTRRLSTLTDALTPSDGILYWALRMRLLGDDIEYADGTLRVLQYRRLTSDDVAALDSLLQTYFPAVLYDVRIVIGAAPSPMLGASDDNISVLGGY